MIRHTQAPTQRPRPRRQGGIALLEAMIAVMILAVGLLGTIGMQARAYSALTDANMRAEATLATDRLLGLMSSDQGNLNGYALVNGAAPSPTLAPWYAATRAVIPGAMIDVTITPAVGTPRNEVKIAIRWNRKAGAVPNVHEVTSYIST